MRQVGMLDLGTEYGLFAHEVRAAVNGVLESQQFINGPPVREFESAMSDRLGVQHAIAVSNGTDALLCTLMALGLGHGDEVIVPAFTFFATAGSVARIGATPVFVDIDAKTFNVDPQQVEAAITDRTKAIIAVHLYGQCADMDAINAVAARHGLPVVEDAAQAIGATYHGRPACSLGRVATLSFYPTKNLGGFGEGGMIATDDDELATIIRQLRNHGESGRYEHERIGGNFRLDSIKAAMLLVKLRYLDRFHDQRQRNAARYTAALEGTDVQTPFVPDGYDHVFHQYTIRSDQRDELRAFLNDRGVSSGVYYPIPLHLQPCFAYLGGKPGMLPVCERACRQVLSLPVHPMLSDDDVDFVACCIHEFFRSRGAAPDLSTAVADTQV